VKTEPGGHQTFEPLHIVPVNHSMFGGCVSKLGLIAKKAKLGHDELPALNLSRAAELSFELICR